MTVRVSDRLMITVAIAHPQAVFRCGIRTTLDSLVRNAVHLEFDSPEQASCDFVQNGLPDTLFVDFPTRPWHGKNKSEQSTTIELLRKVPSVIVVPAVIPNLAKQAKEWGVRGAITINSSLDEVVAACHKLLRDTQAVKVAEAINIERDLQRRIAVNCRNCEGGALTPRQAEILHHLVEGQTNSEIASSLGISVHTVKSHVSAVLRELNVHTRARACVKGRELIAILSREYNR